MTDEEFPNITSETLEAEIRRLAAEFPDKVYVKEHESGFRVCLYVETVDGKLCPSCIYGHALHNLGVPLERLARFDENFSNGIREVLAELGIPCDNADVYWHGEVQAWQDGAKPWGDCPKKADEVMANLAKGADND